MKFRPRPRRSLASYLNSNRPYFATVPPSNVAVDRANLDATDRATRPDFELMHATLQQHVLHDPLEPLPVNYNTFLMHLLEAHQKLNAYTEDLESRLEAEIRRHQPNLEDPRPANGFRPADGQAKPSGATAEDTMNESSPLTNEVTASTPMSTVKENRPWRGIGRASIITEELSASKYRRLPSPSHRVGSQRMQSTDLTGDDHQGLPSAFEDAQLNVDDHGKITTLSKPLSKDKHVRIDTHTHTFNTQRLSGKDEDSSSVHASCLSGGLESAAIVEQPLRGGRLDSSLSSTKYQNTTAIQPLSKSALASSVTSEPNMARGGKSLHGVGNLPDLKRRKHLQQRGFSFLADDIMALPENCVVGLDGVIKAQREVYTRHQGHAVRKITPPTSHGSHGGSFVIEEFIKNKHSERLNRPNAPASEADDLMQIGSTGSNRSVLTVVRGSSSRSSSHSYLESIIDAQEGIFVRDQDKRTTSSEFAVAAARASKDSIASLQDRSR